MPIQAAVCSAAQCPPSICTAAKNTTTLERRRNTRTCALGARVARGKRKPVAHSDLHGGFAGRRDGAFPDFQPGTKSFREAPVRGYQFPPCQELRRSMPPRARVLLFSIGMD